MLRNEGRECKNERGCKAVRSSSICPDCALLVLEQKDRGRDDLSQRNTLLVCVYCRICEGRWLSAGSEVKECDGCSPDPSVRRLQWRLLNDTRDNSSLV